MFGGITFFRPTAAFLDWLTERYGGSDREVFVIDAGCGNGVLLEAMLERKIPCMGIDLQADKIRACHDRIGRILGATSAIHADVVGHPITKMKECVLLFARPCHSSWVVDTIKASDSKHPALYISKRGNEEHDLQGMQYVQRCVGMEVGEEGELVWEVHRPHPDYEAPQPFCLVQFRDGTIAWKRESPDPTVWFHDFGRSWFSRHPDDIVLQRAMVNDDMLLDWSHSTDWMYWDDRVKDTSLMEGWVSPDGKFYRCSYHQHDTLAYVYFRKSTPELEEAGWCRVQESYSSRSSQMDEYDDKYLFVLRDEDWKTPRNLTREQVQALLDAGHTLPDYMLEEAEGDWSHLIGKNQREPV